MAYRKLDKLNPNFRRKVEDFLKEVWDEIFITESWRPQRRQNQLYAQGRTKPWKITTRTRSSMHTKGLAIDFAFKWKNLYPRDLQKRLKIHTIQSR